MYSVCILNYNDSTTTIKLINILKNYNSVRKIVVVDNASTDGSYNELLGMADNQVHILKSDRNGGYGYGNNIGIKYCYEVLHEKYVAICNPDILVEESSLIACCTYLKEHPDTTISVPQMLDRNGTLVEQCVWPIQSGMQYLCFSLKLLGGYFDKKYEYDSSDVKAVDCVAGSLLVVETESFIKYGLYDENIFLFCEETVLGLRLKQANRKSVLLRNVTFTHYHSVSINKSIESKISQKKIMWNSRLYVLKEYYNCGRAKMLFASLIRNICMVEEYIAIKKNILLER